jgi:4'-phosphopantetheinyl transferase EntD
VIRELLPRKIAVVEIRDRGGELPALFPQEAAQVQRAIESRRREFVIGRACARAALVLLDDRPPLAIPVGDGRAPVWPDGVVGSITHSEGFCAAAVAHGSEFAAVGIDAEGLRPLPVGVSRLVVRPAELCGLPSEISWDAVAFSAKEAVFKAWFPLTGKWLDFLDVELSIDVRAGGFVAVVRPTARQKDAPAEFAGRFSLESGLALTAVCVERAH